MRTQDDVSPPTTDGGAEEGVRGAEQVGGGGEGRQKFVEQMLVIGRRAGMKRLVMLLLRLTGDLDSLITETLVTVRTVGRWGWGLRVYGLRVEG